MAAFLANVGVNASPPVVSPLHADGTFELLSIPEAVPWQPPMVLGWRNKAVHRDPDFTSVPATYRDNRRRAGRAFSMRRAQRGDLIVFLARLVDNHAGFYLAGCLEIDDVLPDVTVDPREGWWDGNAHIRRARTTGSWDSFWVFKGSPKSKLFDRAAPFAREELTTVFGDRLRWPAHRTELQTIGSCTRAVRRIEGAGEEWLRSICPS